MRFLFEFNTDDARKRWLNNLQGSKLGWVIYAAPRLSFSPVHRVLDDPELGPVILLGETVFEVDIDGEVYPTREAAANAYYETITSVTDGRPAALVRARPRVRFFAVASDGRRTEITDLYWFEENGVHSLDDVSTAGERIEAVIEP